MKRKYKKANCQLCKAEKKTYWFYPITKREEKDIFYCCYCLSCKTPMIVYKWHNEPTDEEIDRMIEWAKKHFPNRVIDFTRGKIIDHFHFHMRIGVGKVDIKKRISLFQCSDCGKYFTSKEMGYCPRCENLYCKKCLFSHSDNDIDSEEEYEEIQLDDMDWYSMFGEDEE